MRLCKHGEHTQQGTLLPYPYTKIGKSYAGPADFLVPLAGLEPARFMAEGF